MRKKDDFTDKLQRPTSPTSRSPDLALVNFWENLTIFNKIYVILSNEDQEFFKLKIHWKPKHFLTLKWVLNSPIKQSECKLWKSEIHDDFCQSWEHFCFCNFSSFRLVLWHRLWFHLVSWDLRIPCSSLTCSP